MPADTNSAASSNTVSGGSAAITGAGYSAQAADIAGTDERPGADGGRGTPTHDAQTTTDGSSEEDVATLKAALKAARAEAAATRKKAQELDELKQQLEDAKLSETEKLQKQLADYKAQIEALNLQKQEIALRARIDGAAASLGIKPELALRILDQSLVKYDEKGLPTNISELLSSAIEDFDLTPATSTAPSASSPVKPAVTSGGATSPARSTSGANGQHSLAAGEWTDARIASLTRDEYLA
ncbi:MAG TPA: hypothetical protein VFN78_15385, partial [Ktedonobacterales bacterium]|nr:hypothetical protein [Ktedonobacterales bacterium]